MCFFSENQPFSPTSTATGTTTSAADSNSSSSSSTKSFVACKVCGDKASGKPLKFAHLIKENENVLIKIINLTGYHYGVTSCEGCKVSIKRKRFKYW